MFAGFGACREATVLARRGARTLIRFCRCPALQSCWPSDALTGRADVRRPSAPRLLRRSRMPRRPGPGSHCECLGITRRVSWGSLGVKGRRTWSRRGRRSRSRTTTELKLENSTPFIALRRPAVAGTGRWCRFPGSVGGVGSWWPADSSKDGCAPAVSAGVATVSPPGHPESATSSAPRPRHPPSVSTVSGSCACTKSSVPEAGLDDELIHDVLDRVPAPARPVCMRSGRTAHLWARRAAPP